MRQKKIHAQAKQNGKSTQLLAIKNFFHTDTQFPLSQSLSSRGSYKTLSKGGNQKTLLMIRTSHSINTDKLSWHVIILPFQHHCKLLPRETALVQEILTLSFLSVYLSPVVDILMEPFRLQYPFFFTTAIKVIFLCSSDN